MWRPMCLRKEKRNFVSYQIEQLLGKREENLLCDHIRLNMTRSRNYFSLVFAWCLHQFPFAQTGTIYIGCPRSSIIRDHLRVLLKPLGLVVRWCLRGFREVIYWATMILRDTSIFEGCMCNHCRNYSPARRNDVIVDFCRVFLAN